MTELTHKLPHRSWSKPSRNEEEYFHREEFHHRMREARQREAARDEQERRRLADMHQGHCPRCGAELEGLHMAQGSAHQCPNCLGVWLDHETFERLTRTEAEADYLTDMFREVLLHFTTGRISTESDGGPG